MNAIVTRRNFLIRQENGKDVIARKGEIISVSDKEIKQFAKDLKRVDLKKK